MNDDLASMLAVSLGSLIKEFGLKVIRLDDVEALLVSQSYALNFAADRDGLDVMYIERDRHGQLAAYTLRPLVLERFTQEDRVRYGSPTMMKERLIASLNVYASGLGNRCRDVLSGDKSWLKRDSWSAGKPSAAAERALQNEWSS